LSRLEFDNTRKRLNVKTHQKRIKAQIAPHIAAKKGKLMQQNLLSENFAAISFCAQCSTIQHYFITDCFD
jgi:hypothetical protein